MPYPLPSTTDWLVIHLPPQAFPRRFPTPLGGLIWYYYYLIGDGPQILFHAAACLLPHAHTRQFLSWRQEVA